MISCTFAGHREVYGRNVESSIEFAIESILKKDNSFVFYSGDMGEFDKMCSAAVRTAKRRHPELDIKLMVVLPYMMAKINTDKDFYKIYMTTLLFRWNYPTHIINQRLQSVTAGSLTDLIS